MAGNEGMIIDSHHHLWKVARGDYFWMDPEKNPAISTIVRDFLVDDYQSLAQASGIRGSVLVQAAQTTSETNWLLDQAQASNGLILGVVGWIDMEARDAPEQLAHLAQNKLLRGIRPMLQDIADVDWVLQPKLNAAVLALIDLGLTFDLLIKPPHLASALNLLTRYPDLRSVVDHGAKPAMRNGLWQPWADGIARIAKETNAYCKLSGLVTEAKSTWTIEDLRPYVDHLIECFGPKRLMWGSDWPVALLASGYSQWLETAQVLLSPLDATDRDRIMAENTVRFYHLKIVDK
jgi:L-fuconolactonase